MLRGNSVVRVGYNSHRTHTRAKNTHTGCLHAEMDALIAAKPGDKLVVFRWTKDSDQPTMAKPCKHCQQQIREAGIKKTYYSDWSGEIRRMK